MLILPNMISVNFLGSIWLSTQSHIGDDFIWDSTQGFLSDVQILCGSFQLPFQDRSISGIHTITVLLFLFMNHFKTFLLSQTMQRRTLESRGSLMMLKWTTGKLWCSFLIFLISRVSKCIGTYCGVLERVLYQQYNISWVCQIKILIIDDLKHINGEVIVGNKC